MRNIGLEEVAKYLRLSPQRLALIEADKYEGMGASAFVRGYLRAYARFLNIPEQEILNSFGESGFASDICSNKPKLIHEKMVQHARPFIIRRIIYLVFLAGLASAGFWWHNHVNKDKNSASAEAEYKSPSPINELNQQGVSQVVDPSAVDPQGAGAGMIEKGMTGEKMNNSQIPSE